MNSAASAQDALASVCGGLPSSLALALLREQDRLRSARAAAAELIAREKRISAMRLAAAARAQAMPAQDRQRAAVAERLSRRRTIIEELTALNKPVAANNASVAPLKNGLATLPSLQLPGSVATGNSRGLIRAALDLADESITERRDLPPPPALPTNKVLPFSLTSPLYAGVADAPRRNNMISWQT